MFVVVRRKGQHMFNQEYLRRQQQAVELGCSVKTLVRWGQDSRKNLPPEYDIPGGPSRRIDQWKAWRESQRITSSEVAA
jgi:hypothetical protein